MPRSDRATTPSPPCSFQPRSGPLAPPPVLRDRFKFHQNSSTHLWKGQGLESNAPYPPTPLDTPPVWLYYFKREILEPSRSATALPIGSCRNRPGWEFPLELIANGKDISTSSSVTRHRRGRLTSLACLLYGGSGCALCVLENAVIFALVFLPHRGSYFSQVCSFIAGLFLGDDLV